MTVEEISKMAFQDIGLDVATATAQERLLWFALREIYRKYAGDKEEGARQKDAALQQYEMDCADWVRADHVRRFIQNFEEQVDPAAKAYAKDPRLETSDKLFEALYYAPREEKLAQWEKGGGAE